MLSLARFSRRLLGVSLALALGCVGAAAETDPWTTLTSGAVRALKAGAIGEAERLGNSAVAMADGFDAHDVRRVNACVLMGEISLRAGKPAQAETWYHKGIAMAEAAFGSTSAELIAPLESLVNFHFYRDHLDLAAPFAARLLAIAEHAAPLDRREIANRTRNLADLYLRLKRHADAEVLYKRALLAAEAANGPDHIDVSEYLRALAECYRDESRFDQAEPPAKRALAVAEKNLGLTDLGLAVPLETLGEIYLGAKQPERAEPLFRRSLHIVEKVSGPDNPDIARPLLGLAAALQALGRMTEAESALQRAERAISTGLSADAPELVPVLERQGALMEATGHHREAESLRARATRLRKNATGP